MILFLIFTQATLPLRYVLLNRNKIGPCQWGLGLIGLSLGIGLSIVLGPQLLTAMLLPQATKVCVI